MQKYWIMDKDFFKEDMEFATEEFYRGDKSRHDRSHQGLGLAIVKRFWSHRRISGTWKFRRNRRGRSDFVGERRRKIKNVALKAFHTGIYECNVIK